MMIDLRSDSNTLPTSPLIFTGGLNISKFGLNLTFEEGSFRDEATNVNQQTALKVQMNSLSSLQIWCKSLLQFWDLVSAKQAFNNSALGCSISLKFGTFVRYEPGSLRKYWTPHIVKSYVGVRPQILNL